MLSPMEHSRHEEDRYLFHLPGADGSERWLQLFYREDESLGLGAFLDVSKDVESKRRIEYERDFDILTDLYNRRAFDQRLEHLCRTGGEEPLGMAAMLMFDLDNLKYVNDTYGHDYGDRYIQAFAGALEYLYQYRAVIGRRSRGMNSTSFCTGSPIRRRFARRWKNSKRRWKTVNSSFLMEKSCAYGLQVD